MICSKKIIITTFGLYLHDTIYLLSISFVYNQYLMKCFEILINVREILNSERSEETIGFTI